MAGVTGLDYAAVVAYLNEDGITGPSRRQVFDGIRVLERETLNALAERRKG